MLALGSGKRLLVILSTHLPPVVVVDLTSPRPALSGSSDPGPVVESEPNLAKGAAGRIRVHYGLDVDHE